MSSLQEQLMKAGLADKKKATKIKHEKRKKAKQQPKGHKVKDELKEQIEAEKRKKAEQDRVLNEQRQAELKAKEQRAMLKQMLEHHGVDEFKGEVPYNYIHDGLTKTLKVNETIKQCLAKGTLAICAMDGKVRLVPDVIARKLQTVDPEVVLVMHDRMSKQEIDEDDPYAEYQVPDDLIW
ncbi:DUF2058 domain-containing protein [Pleionea sediminis]|uniref:DUF2058 domain-containing protein n=1 Tax=Pleionea sediminis TaxID=2569479 RepID=UPI0011864856|nr:DUF2058 domain-containing protein [Pleionea sediminis]